MFRQFVQRVSGLIRVLQQRFQRVQPPPPPSTNRKPPQRLQPKSRPRAAKKR